MSRILASIDLGSHTARLLIARRSGSPGRLTPLLRERAYIRLAEGLGRERQGEIGRDLCDRVLQVMGRFSRMLADFEVERVLGVATGVIRDARNRDEFLKLIYRESGIPIRVISGDREALLSGKGALGAMNFAGDGCLVFDLGGGTTEFFYKRGEIERTKSLPLGAATLTSMFVRSDPPDTSELRAVAAEVERRLTGARIELPQGGLLIGTGGSVTTIATMVHRISPGEIRPERLNGLELNYPQVAACLEEMAGMDLERRRALDGLDPERARVILAGALVVMGIMRHTGSSRATVSMSDLLEGLLIDES